MTQREREILPYDDETRQIVHDIIPSDLGERIKKFGAVYHAIHYVLDTKRRELKSSSQAEPKL